MARILSGIQPSGALHLGNYFGAIEQHLQLQGQGEAFYFIANYHALTSVKDKNQLLADTYAIAATYLALGLDPNLACIYRQSDIPEVTELSWILGNVINVGALQRSHAYKDKVEKGLPASVGLFTYPVLMAADILLVQAEVIPVGQDQIQHIEIAADIAGSFNHTFGETFKIPAHRITAASKVLGTDGNKMSKSYHNTIPIFDKPGNIKKIVSGIKTDAKDFKSEPLTVDGEIVFHLYSLLASPEEIAELKDRYLNDRTFGYGHAKQRLIAKLEETFGRLLPTYETLLDNRVELDRILEQGAAKARKIAFSTMEKVRKAVGLC